MSLRVILNRLLGQPTDGLTERASAAQVLLLDPARFAPLRWELPLPRRRETPPKSESDEDDDFPRSPLRAEAAEASPGG